MSADPGDEDLALVAQHGTTDLTRALATVRLARRRGRLDELRDTFDLDGED